jgi:hypothetical protein
MYCLFLTVSSIPDETPTAISVVELYLRLQYRVQVNDRAWTATAIHSARSRDAAVTSRRIAAS